MAGRFVQLDIMPKAARLYAARSKLKSELRQEYLKKFTNPHVRPTYTFDEQVQRWYTLHMKLETYYEHTLKDFVKYFVLIPLPMILYAILLHSRREEYEKKCRSGELKYEDRVHRFIT